jgi:sugar diacid utilization regulator
MTRPARSLSAVPDPPVTDLGALEAISVAVEAGDGLPEIVRAAARALDASLALVDPAGSVLAVAARSENDESSLVSGGEGVRTEELTVAEEVVGKLRIRQRSELAPAVLSLVKTLIAGEVRRVQAPDRAAERETSAFFADLLARRVSGREEIVAGAAGLGIELGAGGAMLVVRAHIHVAAGDDWRGRVLAVAQRGARSVAVGALAARFEGVGPGDEVFVLLPGADAAIAERAGIATLRELETSLGGCTFAVGRSRVASDPGDLHRAGHEALLAANVADTDAGSTILAFEETGAYRLLLPAMSEDPLELQRFYAETLEPLAAYDEQYETDLVQTLETYFDSDGNVAGTAAKLFTHRHTVRYRLERIRELCGLDVGSTDGREKLSLGLKAMRVLGISAPRGPASELGTEAGRVPSGPRDSG